MTDIETIRASAQDRGTRTAIKVLDAITAPKLILLGWVQRAAGEDGLGCWDKPRGPSTVGLRMIHSIARCEGEVWSHVSVSRSDHKMPTWEQTRDVYRIVHPNRYGIVVIPPETNHVNIAEVAHVWCCLDRPAAPDFTYGLGTI